MLTSNNFFLQTPIFNSPPFAFHLVVLTSISSFLSSFSFFRPVSSLPLYFFPQKTLAKKGKKRVTSLFASFFLLKEVIFPKFLHHPLKCCVRRMRFERWCQAGRGKLGTSDGGIKSLRPKIEWHQFNIVLLQESFAPFVIFFFL